MKYADYIQQIEIDALWDNQKHIVWQLDRQVNILSGINGVGKTTILNKVLKAIDANGKLKNAEPLEVHIKPMPKDAEGLRFDVIRSFDKPLIAADAVLHLERSVVTELDRQLFQLQRKYLDYQVNIGNRMIATLQEGGDTSAAKAQKLALSRHHRHAVCRNGKKDSEKRERDSFFYGQTPFNALRAVERRETNSGNSAHGAGARRATLCAFYGRA